MLKRFAVQIIVALGFFALWQQAAVKLSPLILPSPGETWSRLVWLWQGGSIGGELLISFRRTLIGFASAYALALVLAVLIHKFRWLRIVIQPWLDVLQIVPTIVWLILAVLWFGIAREATPIFVVFVVCLPIVLVQIREGLAAIPAELRDLAALEPMGLGVYTVHVVLPSLVPALLSAATLGFSFAWRAVVFAEFVGSNSGLGYQLSRAYHNLATDEVFAWTLILIALMWGWQVLLVGKWRRWAGSKLGQ